MFRHIAALGLVLLVPVFARAQDSGPGPVAPDTVKTYDATLYQRATTNTASFDFQAAADTSTASTTGDFDTTINGEAFTGTWYAYDLGAYSFWAATGKGPTNQLASAGWATPDFIVGRATISPAGGRPWFLRLFSRNSYLIFGKAAAAPAPAPAS